MLMNGDGGDGDGGVSVGVGDGDGGVITKHVPWRYGPHFGTHQANEDALLDDVQLWTLPSVVNVTILILYAI